MQLPKQKPNNPIAAHKHGDPAVKQSYNRNTRIEARLPRIHPSSGSRFFTLSHPQHWSTSFFLYERIFYSAALGRLGSRGRLISQSHCIKPEACIKQRTRRFSSTSRLLGKTGLRLVDSTKRSRWKKFISQRIKHDALMLPC